MTLDEAITHAREIAKFKMREATYNSPTLKTHYDGQVECAREYKQLAYWLEELKQYKAIGLTPDQLREIDKLYSEQAKELVEYRKLGTLEEVREAVEKQTAISREIIEGKYFCHKCHNLMPYPGYCRCGQRLY